jgi:hypothetical protein
MKKTQLFILILMAFILFSQVARAEECGITNLASCIPEKIFEYFLSVLNAPLQPLLNWIHDLLTEPVNTNLFSSIWSIIVYILSLFYGLFLLFIGFKFLLAGYSPEQRENAKKNLANIIIMMVLVQSSFILYSIILQIAGGLTSGVFNLISPDFFILTIDNLPNIALQFTLVLPYVAQLLITLILLVLRYVLVCAGIVLFPIGIFCYFIEPLQNYGKLILNTLIVIIIMPFFYTIIFLASSKLLQIPLFQNMKMVVMIGAFTLVNVGTLALIIFVIVKAALKVATPIMRIASIVAKVA